MCKIRIKHLEFQVLTVTVLNNHSTSFIYGITGIQNQDFHIWYYRDTKLRLIMTNSSSIHKNNTCYVDIVKRKGKLGFIKGRWGVWLSPKMASILHNLTVIMQ